MARLEQLGKYQLIKRIAVGGMSEIYLASQGGLEGFERAVIVKCIRDDLMDEREVLDMFLDEARIAACLKQANIVHLYDVGVGETGIPYLAMEYIFGRDLLEIADRARSLGWELPIQFILKVICDALAGLHYAHMVAEFEDRPLRMIHRDVSPQNIIVSFDGVTKLVDFGISKAEARLSETRAGVLKGKYAYMSPEQVRGKPLDHRSDQFSLAVVFYEVITGTRLFQRDTDYSTMEAVDRCEIPPMKVLRKDVPRRLIRALRKAMRKNSKRRFKSCMDMERYLHKLLRGSAVERTEEISGFMRKLFTQELEARENAIAQAPEAEREIIISTGFEMIKEGATKIDPIPEPPMAQKRYEEILAERQAEKTQLRSEPLADAPTPDDLIATDREGGPVGTTMRKATPTSMFNDWRFLVLVFVAVMVLGLFLLTMLSGEDEITPAPPDLGKPQPMATTARPGIDGFLSVSVAPRVRVFLDGEDKGTGAFRKYPVERGIHKVKLMDLESGDTRTITVNVKADEEFIVSPMDYQ
jgi:serine/threonine-protein kinase